MADELIGKTIGGYEILDIVGRGGMATVYRAQQVSMKRIVALKMLPKQYVQDDTYLQRFNQEVKIVSQLEHRNIVPVHDYGEYSGQPYIVMRYMNAGSVDDMLNNGPLEIETIVDIIDQIAPALDYAHSKSVLHRDLKPSNLLLDDDGGAYLTDFGIARILGEQSSGITTQGVVGTPSYMSPEQAQGLPLDNRSDIYSLGVMLFEMATGRRPFESDTPYGIAVLQVTTPPPSPRVYNPQLSFAVEEIIYKALKKKREERYPHAIGLAEALKRAVNKPVASIHDTQPGFQRPQLPPADVAPPPASIPLPTAPPPVYAAPPSVSQPMAAAPSATGYVSYVPRRRPRGSNAWMGAALGGLIGCGLLAVLLIIALLVLNNFMNGGGASADQPQETPTTRSESRSTTDPLTAPLDPTSQTARNTLLPPVPTGTASPLPPLLVTPTPGIAPVGVPPTATLSPELRALEGGLVFFAERDDNFDLYWLDWRSGIETRLTFGSDVDSYPSVSPDGSRIAFQSDRDGDFEIYIMDLNGRNLRRLTDNTVLDRLASWSPDGEWIIFSSDVRNNGQLDLLTIRPDGTDLQPVFSNGERNSHARWSPDGRYLVFTTGDGETGAAWEVGRLDTETSAFVRLTRNSFKDWSPAFSPDGSAILYLSGGEGESARGNSAIALMNRDGRDARILYDGPGYEWGASFSPDGRYITFTSMASSTAQEEIFIMNADGTDVRQVTNSGGLYAVWIPTLAGGTTGPQ